MRTIRVAALAGCVLLGSVLAADRAPLLGSPQLRPTFGGVVLETTMTPRAGVQDELIGVWAAGSRAKLMACQPRCRVVKSIPLDAPLLVGSRSSYRIVLGGSFTPGRRVGIILSFRSGMRSAEVTVARGTAYDPRP